MKGKLKGQNWSMTIPC